LRTEVRVFRRVEGDSGGGQTSYKSRSHIYTPLDTELTIGPEALATKAGCDAKGME
jgi:hypothetical protein